MKEFLNYLPPIFIFLVTFLSPLWYNLSGGDNMDSGMWTMIGTIAAALVGLIASVIVSTKSSNSKIRDVKDEILKSQKQAEEKLAEGNIGIAGTHTSLSAEHKEIKNYNEKLYEIGKNTYGKIENVDRFLLFDQARREALAASGYAGLQKSAEQLNAILKDWELKVFELDQEREKNALLVKQNAELSEENINLKEKLKYLEEENEEENSEEFEL